MNEKVAISIWNKRISPVMDTASQFLIFKVDNEHQVVFREIVEIPPTNISNRVRNLLSHEITILICGAISRHLEQALSASGIDVQPFLGGNVEDITMAYSKGTFNSDNYLLPGCRRGHRRGKRSRFNRKQIR